MNKNFVDLSVMLILAYKDDMIEEGIIPKDVKWTELTEKQEQNIIKFLEEKIEEKKGEDKNDNK